MPNSSPDSSSETTCELIDRVWLPSDWCELNVAVSLSGGADSMALLRALLHLKHQKGGAGQLMALHVNHQLRGEESTADARWCCQQCESLGVPLQVMTCNTAQSAADAGDGIEAAARAERYKLLTTAAEQAGVRYLATAHTQNDQVETVLFRVLRGTGLRGLAGIPRSRALTPSLTLIRPLLDCSRELVIDYLSHLNQDYRTDHTNADTQFTRNRLRHDLLPQLREQYNSDFDTALLRLASQASETQVLIESDAHQLLEKAKLPSEANVIAISCQKISGHAPIIVSEALRIAWREAGFAEQAMTHQWWSQLTEMALHPVEGQVFNLPGNVRASIDGQRFVLQQQ